MLLSPRSTACRRATCNASNGLLQSSRDTRGSVSRRNRRRRNGLTLTEVMIAIAITLVLLGVLIRMFNYASGEIKKGRAIMELSGQVRMTTDRLQSDLNGLTVPMRPWNRTADGLGYFEYFEGVPHVDDPTAVDTTWGDFDDVLMFTARSKDRPFRGRYWSPNGAPTIIESDFAEIIWWAELKDTNVNGLYDTGEQIILHRRVLLIRPDLNDALSGNLVDNNNLKLFYDNNDISVRPTSLGLSANSLADLCRRENRFAHFIGYPAPNFAPNDIDDLNNHIVSSFPYPIDRAWLSALTISGNYEGEDTILSSVVSFDVKAFDTTVKYSGGIGPSDPGYAGSTTFPNDAAGGYVDLGYASVYDITDGIQDSDFSGPPAVKSQFPLLPLEAQLVYSTWPDCYETDGIDQDGSGTIDQGTNGLDDDGLNGTDDEAERETSPPYPLKLRGIQVTVRVIEPDTQQVEQRTIVQSFVPE